VELTTHVQRVHQLCGRGNIWFTTATQFEFCFANQTQAAMSSYCAILHKAEE
jgi:hypothetical protein